MGKHSKPDDDDILAALDFEPDMILCEAGRYARCSLVDPQDCVDATFLAHPADYLFTYTCGCQRGLCAWKSSGEKECFVYGPGNCMKCHQWDIFIQRIDEI